MNLDLTKTWLQKYKSANILKKYIETVLSFSGGMIVLFITFWLTYFVAWLASSGFCSLIELIWGAKFAASSTWLKVVSGIFMALLFVQYIRMDAWSWGRYARKEVNLDPRLRSDVEELAPSVKILAHSDTMAKSIADILVIGPRLLFGVTARLKEAAQIRQMEIDKCAAALAFIYAQPDATSYEEFCQAGWEAQINQLKNIGGLYFLKSGMLLSDELKAELKDLS